MATEVGRSRPLPLVKSGNGEGNERRRRRRLRLGGRPAISGLSSAGGSLLCSWTQDGDGRPAGFIGLRRGSVGDSEDATDQEPTHRFSVVRLCIGAQVAANLLCSVGVLHVRV